MQQAACSAVLIGQLTLGPCNHLTELPGGSRSTASLSCLSSHLGAGARLSVCVPELGASGGQKFHLESRPNLPPDPACVPITCSSSDPTGWEPAEHCRGTQLEPKAWEGQGQEGRHWLGAHSRSRFILLGQRQGRPRKENSLDLSINASRPASRRSSAPARALRGRGEAQGAMALGAHLPSRPAQAGQSAPAPRARSAVAGC